MNRMDTLGWWLLLNGVVLISAAGLAYIAKILIDATEDPANRLYSEMGLEQPE